MARTILIISQTFAPDPASVGQHMADVAVEMARRGHRVLVYTANRGYDDPTIKYPRRENYRDVEIRRLRFSSFGKKTILTRVIGTASFMAQCLFIALTTPKLMGIFFSTSPPLVGVVASIVRFVRRVPIVYWAMDLNPDQLIAMGKIRPRGPVAWVLERANRIVLHSSDLVIALDRFMADRLSRRTNLAGRLLTMPPWPHDEHIEPIEHAANRFRNQHHLDGKFVVMYSGNHSPANPLRTVLESARELRGETDLVFLFVGGGIGKKEVEEFISANGCANMLSLPYQPMEDLRYSLSAADVHVVSMGDDMVGIIHPCKIYGAMAVGRPILYVGPRPSHIDDLLAEHGFGIHIKHGDVPAAVAAIRRLKAMSADERNRWGSSAQQVLRAGYGQAMLCGRLCDALEQVFGSRRL